MLVRVWSGFWSADGFCSLGGCGALPALGMPSRIVGKSTLYLYGLRVQLLGACWLAATSPHRGAMGHLDHLPMTHLVERVAILEPVTRGS